MVIFVIRILGFDDATFSSSEKKKIKKFFKSINVEKITGHIQISSRNNNIGTSSFVFHDVNKKEVFSSIKEVIKNET
jgi:hypothetical protein